MNVNVGLNKSTKCHLFVKKKIRRRGHILMFAKYSFLLSCSKDL